MHFYTPLKAGPLSPLQSPTMPCRVTQLTQSQALITKSKTCHHAFLLRNPPQCAPWCSNVPPMMVSQRPQWSALRSAVHIATIYNQPEMIQLLVSHDHGAPSTNKSGQDPTTIGTSIPDTFLATMHLVLWPRAPGARLDLHDSQGHTPLHLACRNAHFGPKHLETVRRGPGGRGNGRGGVEGHQLTP